MPLLDPREYVDREQQQSMLQAMVDGEDEACLLLIVDASGQGKSDLLRRLRVNCRERAAGPTQVLLADLRDLTTPFGAVERATSSADNMDVVGAVLRGYVEESERRARTAYVQLEQSGVTNELPVHGTVEPGAVVANQYIVAPAPTGVATMAAQRECCAAFLRDLAGWEDGPLVVLIDHYNKASDSLQQWVDEHLIRPCLGGQLGRVVVVMATTPELAPGYAPYGDRVHVTQLAPLHERPEHVERLLRAHHILSEPDAPLVDVAVDRLRRGMIIEELLNALNLLAVGGG